MTEQRSSSPSLDSQHSALLAPATNLHSVVAVFDTVRRRWPGPDAYMSPGEGCLDCFVGEPHVCPLLAWTTLTIIEDEHGVCTVAEAS